ncbi:P-loop containing nucleoside triphosphate hydrolase protein [Pleurotus eryngii]|uniref:ATP-dependent DNA helicase n=1 Tax=Pleurotus eryngii TaxID=5323 RepID=A0A9P6A8Y1_PLEER|nr:P-loop containing nucleoside triphosphate hydrolase protein [Pleurotus eryngii]
MSDSEGYFDDDPINFDAEALGQLDAIEAAALAVDNVPQSDYDDSFGDLSLALDPAEAARLDAYIAEVIDVDAQPSTSTSTLSRSTSRTTLQTTLFGDILQPQASSSRPKPTNSIQRTKSNPKTPFGRPAPKTKKWDHTAFAKTGLRKPLPKSKNKDGQDAHDSDEEGEEFEQFPAPFVPVAPPPPMKLEPDLLEARHWIYPLNRPKRDYQFNIVKHSLFENTLVALPTGLGKTFIAGVVMLNYYRWFPEGKVVFVAPTKPLVSQQIDACHRVCGIPGNDAIELTGDNVRALRAKAWHDKRVIYMTPQTLVNDLTKETCDPMDIVLLVIDEAHRATGQYAYSQAVRYLMAKNPHIRILALTATPGGTPEKVQDLVDALHISHIEIRDEHSLDLKPFIHEKRIEQHIIKMNGDINRVMAPLAKLMESVLKPLASRGVVHSMNVYNAHPFYFQKQCQQLGPNQKWAYQPLFRLSGLARAMGYLQEASVSMCYKCLLSLAEDSIGDGTQKKATAVSNAKNFRNDPLYKTVIQEFEAQKARKFTMHPKLDRLKTFLVQHFGGRLADAADEAEAPEETRAMVFVTFRECVEEIVEALNFDRPMLRAAAFIGQGTDRDGKKGLAQKEQLELIKKFKAGEYNVLVATSIGEEGLDIGEVDLIICYDAQKTPIRMLQRVGRTGRKRSGVVHVLLAEGREEQNFDKAKDAYSHVQKSICSGEDLELYGDVERLLPGHIKPECLEKAMDIVEYVRSDEYRRVGRTKSAGKNAEQDPRVPKRKRNEAPDRNMPYGAVSGFVAASKLTKKRKIKISDKELEAAGVDNSSDREIETELFYPPPPRRTQSSTAAPPTSTGEAKSTLKRSATTNVAKKKSTKKGKAAQSPEPARSPSPEKYLSDEKEALGPPIHKTIPKSAPKKVRKKAPSIPPVSPIPPSPPTKRLPDILEVSWGEDEGRQDIDSPRSKERSQPQPASASGSNNGVVDSMAWLVDGSDDEPSIQIISSSPPPPGAFSLDDSMEVGEPMPVTCHDSCSRVTPPLDPLSRPSSPLWSSPRKPLSPIVAQAWGSPPNHGANLRSPNFLSPPVGKVGESSRGKTFQCPPTTFPVRPIGRLQRKRALPDIELDSPSVEMPPPSQRRLKRKTSSSNVPKVSKGKGKGKGKARETPGRQHLNPLFDVAAEHSGDEVSAGSSHSEDNVEDETDRVFIKDLATQVSPSYDQSLIYRQSLLSQYPGRAGPAFKDKPVRTGAFGPKRAAKQCIISSSPERGNESPDEYQFGSFVVDDSAEIIYSDGPSFD